MAKQCGNSLPATRQRYRLLDTVDCVAVSGYANRALEIFCKTPAGRTFPAAANNRMKEHTFVSSSSIQEPTGTSSSQPGEVRREILELIKMVLLFLVLFLLLKTFVIEGYEVQGPSMFPTLENGERILVLKLPLKLSHLPLLSVLDPVDQGDIVVFESQGGTKKRYIKRVVAKGPKQRGNMVNADVEAAEPGVRVQFLEGEVYVDHRRLPEDYLSPEEQLSPDLDDIVLGNEEYYVLGDHRSLSKDSRSFGPIHEDQLIGVAVLRFWPPVKAGFL